MRTLSYILILTLIFQLGCTNSNEDKNNIKNNNKIEKNNKVKSNDENEKYTLKFGRKSIDIEFNFNKLDKSTERIFKNVAFKSLFHIGGIMDTIFNMPIGVRIDDKHNIYVLDELDKSVKKFSKTGKFLGKFGRTGRGPGEFLFAQGFDVDNNGKIVIADPNNNKITVFDKDKVFEFKCRYGPLKVSFVSPSEVIIHQMLEPIFSSSVRKIDYVNNTVTDYQNILNKDSFGDKTFGVLPFLVGDLLRYKNNYSVYTSKVLNFVVVFNKIGKIYRVFKMLDDDFDLRQISIEKFSNKKVYILSSIDGDKLFICKNITTKGKKSKVVDVFSISLGDYLYSFNLDFITDLWAVQFSDNKMYALKENTEIEVFSFKLGNKNYCTFAN